MKRVYFIRHGQSKENVGENRQTMNAPLTAHGRKQAHLVAKRVAHFPVDVIISSTMSRAKETAHIISNEIGKKVELSELFIEKRRPSELIGRTKNDPETFEIEELIVKNFTIPETHYSDEENFEDLKERATKILDYLIQRPEKNILVVTHGFILRTVMARMILGKDLTAEEGLRFIQTFHMENTGITVIGHDEKRKNPWWLWVWNDHAHLDELTR